MSLKAKIEAIIYAAEEPVTLIQLTALLADELAELQEQAAEAASIASKNRGDNAAYRDTEAAEPQEPSTYPGEEAENPGVDATVSAPLLAEADATAKKAAREQDRKLRDLLRAQVDTLVADYAASERGMEIREVAGGYRMGTKPEYHDTVRSFVKSLKPVMKLSLQALETLAVVAYKQPVTAPEISEIRGVDSGGVLGGLLSRKLITTAGRKQVIGRPILYKTTREFLLRFGLKDINELPSMEEFEKMAGELAEQDGLPLGEAQQEAARPRDASTQAMTSEAPALDEFIEDGSSEIVEQAASHELHEEPPHAKAERNGNA